LVTAALTTESGRAEATIVALAVATWGALKVFRGLSLAFDKVYDEVAEDSIVDQIRDGLTVIVAGAGALALMIGIGAMLQVVADSVPFAGLLSWIVLLGGLILVFLPIYYVLPPIPVELTEVIPGVVFAAVGWTVLQIDSSSTRRTPASTRRTAPSVRSSCSSPGSTSPASSSSSVPFSTSSDRDPQSRNSGRE